MPTDINFLTQHINAQVVARAAELATSFAEAKPFRHIQIDDFFTPEASHELAAEFPAFDERLAISEDGIVGNKAVHEKIMLLGPAWKSLDELVQHASFRQLISDITGIPDLQYDPHYFGGGTHENRHGQGLDAHIDFNFHPITRQHRRLNLIVYLTHGWQDDWGGAIQLHKDPYLPPSQDQVVSITPQFNRCVIFETNEHSWHGFPRIQIPQDQRSITRKSFALYYYTDTRSEDDTGAEHSTIYVDEHLPTDIRPGGVLSEAQFHKIQGLLGSRDQHLKRLYEQIKQNNTVYNELKAFHTEQMSSLNHLREEFQRLQKASDIAVTGTRAELEALESVIGKRDQDIIDLNQKIRDMETSTSWRLTWPMRQVKKLFLSN